MKYKLLTGIGLSIIAYILFRVIFSGLPKLFPVHPAKVDRIELIGPSLDSSEKDQIIPVTDPEVVRNFILYFQKVGWGSRDTPSCPFNLPIIFYEGEKQIAIDLATDDCGIIRHGDYYYHLNLGREKILELQRMIGELGVDFERVRF